MKLLELMEELEKRLTSFDTVQSEKELTFDTEVDLMADINKAVDFTDKVRDVKVKAT